MPATHLGLSIGDLVCHRMHGAGVIHSRAPIRSAYVVRFVRRSPGVAKVARAVDLELVRKASCA